MTIHLQDGTVLDRIWLHADGGIRQIKEVHTKLDGLIWERPKIGPLPSGTHDWTPAQDGSAVGYYLDVFGVLTPTSFEGVEIQYLQVLPTNKFRLAFVGSVHPAGVDVVELSYTVAVNRAVNMYWVSSLGVYESEEAIEASEYVRRHVDELRPINLVNLTA